MGDLAVGDQVSWVDALGNERFGTINEIEPNGRVHVASAQTNTRGRRVTKVVTCWFDAHETHRLTRKPAPGFDDGKGK